MTAGTPERVPRRPDPLPWAANAAVGALVLAVGVTAAVRPAGFSANRTYISELGSGGGRAAGLFNAVLFLAAPVLAGTLLAAVRRCESRGLAADAARPLRWAAVAAGVGAAGVAAVPWDAVKLLHETFAAVAFVAWTAFAGGTAFAQTRPAVRLPWTLPACGAASAALGAAFLAFYTLVPGERVPLGPVSAGDALWEWLAVASAGAWTLLHARTLPRSPARPAGPLH